MLLKSIAASLALVACIAASLPSARATESKPKLTLLPNQIAVGVEPPVAAPGVARKIVVAGLWPNACVPTGAQLSEASDFGRLTLGILVAEPQTFVACAAVLTSYRIELDYTPQAAGQVPILAITSASKASARGTLVTGSASDPRARYDVSGAWYDPQTSGSGLMITHDFGHSDNIFATWQIYDAASGVSRWYAVQQGQWRADGLAWEGIVFETTADPKACDTLCPSPIAHAAYRATARLTFGVSIAYGGLEAALDLVQGDGSLRRVSNLQRFLPNVIVLR